MRVRTGPYSSSTAAEDAAAELAAAEPADEEAAPDEADEPPQAVSAPVVMVAVIRTASRRFTEFFIYNRQDPWVARELDRLSAALGGDVVEKVRALSREVGIPACLRDAGIPEADFLRDEAQLIAGAMLGSTKVNPIPMTPETIAPIVRAAYYGS